MTAYDRLMTYLEPRRIKRGMFKGQAWLDGPSSRHKRVYEPAPGLVAVRMHNTDILVARQDGMVVLDAGGWRWHYSPTTRECMARALHLAGMPGFLTTRWYSGHRNCALVIRGKGEWVFYDGMVLDSDGNLLSPARKFLKNVANRQRRAAERERLKPFLDMLPILMANIADNPTAYFPARPIDQIDVDDAGTWHSVALYYMWEDGELLTDPRKVRAKIVHAATKDMVRAVPVENV